jgi:hypothetical protein
VSGLDPTSPGREQSAIAPYALRSSCGGSRVTGTPMATFFRCQFCVVEMKRFNLSDGSLRSFASRAT